MKMSRLFTKTNKNAKNYDSINATLLIKAGFIDQTMSGVYTFLPLGLRVLTKIEQIVREEMDKIGVEVFMPSLSPKLLWEKTGRLNSVDVLMKTSAANSLAKKKNDTEYILNCTHEEVITPIVKGHAKSYKDLPCAYYQIQTKFRNEARAKSGLLRSREFRMKDLYSFHASETDLKNYYDKAKEAYLNVFKRLGLGDDTVIALASGGDFTKDYSHEFQTKCETGEDMIFYSQKKDLAYNREVAPSLASEISWDKSDKSKEDIYGENITGMEALVKFLQRPAQTCIKTLIYKTDDSHVIAACVRGDYDINEYKLRKIVGCRDLTLADNQTVKEATGAEVGYAGLINLKSHVRLIVDDALLNANNFECGANRTNYHSINVCWGKDVKKPEKFYDIKMAKIGDMHPESKDKYQVFRASEVGNIFPLNTKFTQAFKYTYTDITGQEKPVYMGSYGIGTSRLMGVIVEKFHDEHGIIWPKSIAPYDVHLVTLPGGEELSEKLYQQLKQKNVSILWDDRDNVSAGEKLIDADLIGIPYRLIVSQRTGTQVEVKLRTGKKGEIMNLEKLLGMLKE